MAYPYDDLDLSQFGTAPFNPNAPDPRLGMGSRGPLPPLMPPMGQRQPYPGTGPVGPGLGKAMQDPGLMRGLISLAMALGGGRYGGNAAQSFQQGNIDR